MVRDFAMKPVQLVGGNHSCTIHSRDVDGPQFRATEVYGLVTAVFWPLAAPMHRG